MAQYPNLRKSILIDKANIKHRMFMAPMDTGFGLLFSGGRTQHPA